MSGSLVARLRAAGCVFAEDEADILREAAATSGADLETLVTRRIAGAPLQHVVGWAYFAGHRYIVSEGVFVPRPRSEFLLRAAIARARPSTIVVDLCCGSGTLGCALERAVSGVELHLADIDPRATGCARRNAPAEAGVYDGDLYAALPSALRGRIDVLVCNAPYVPSSAVASLPREARVHEPLVALDGGDDGLDVHRRVAADASAWLAPGGSLLIETSEGQAASAHAMFETVGLCVDVLHDDELDATVVAARRVV